MPTLKEQENYYHDLGSYIILTYFATQTSAVHWSQARKTEKTDISDNHVQDGTPTVLVTLTLTVQRSSYRSS